MIVFVLKIISSEKSKKKHKNVNGKGAKPQIRKMTKMV
jgi:competence protein ComGF